jgi:hypothetical protein
MINGHGIHGIHGNNRKVKDEPEQSHFYVVNFHPSRIEPGFCRMNPHRNSVLFSVFFRGFRGHEIFQRMTGAYDFIQQQD